MLLALALRRSPINLRYNLHIPDENEDFFSFLQLLWKYSSYFSCFRLSFVISQLKEIGVFFVWLFFHMYRIECANLGLCSCNHTISRKALHLTFWTNITLGSCLDGYWCWACLATYLFQASAYCYISLFIYKYAFFVHTYVSPTEFLAAFAALY